MIKDIYIDTTIPSFATCRPRLDNSVTTDFKRLTLFFWKNLRQNFELFISSYVLSECQLGDSDAAHRRVEFLAEVSIIPDSDQIEVLACKYLELLGIPEKAKMDCYHLAASVESEMDCLLSWNLRHLSDKTYSKVREYNEEHGLKTPLLLTPGALILICQPEDSL
jgi:hypothetical protein